MKSKFVPDQQAQSGGSFGPAWDDPNFENFISPVALDTGSSAPATPIVPTPVLSEEAVQSEAAQSGPTTVVGEAWFEGGNTIKLEFDAGAMAAPASFRAGIEQA